MVYENNGINTLENQVLPNNQVNNKSGKIFIIVSVAFSLLAILLLINTESSESWFYFFYIFQIVVPILSVLGIILNLLYFRKLKLLKQNTLIAKLGLLFGIIPLIWWLKILIYALGVW